MPSWLNTGNLRGPAGPPGEPGPQGSPGPAGVPGPAGLGIQFRGQVPARANLPATPADGDAYIVQAEADALLVWDAETATWVDGGSIQGPPGPPGAQGSQGARGNGWFTGPGDPPELVAGAIPGDLWLNATTGAVYKLS